MPLAPKGISSTMYLFWGFPCCRKFSMASRILMETRSERPRCRALSARMMIDIDGLILLVEGAHGLLDAVLEQHKVILLEAGDIQVLRSRHCNRNVDHVGGGFRRRCLSLHQSCQGQEQQSQLTVTRFLFIFSLRFLRLLSSTDWPKWPVAIVYLTGVSGQ